MAAGDFTNIRVDSSAPDLVTVRYNYAGSGNISLWRSTDNVSFSQVVSIPSDYGSYPTLYDGAVAASTLYYYKLSDDAGSTFTSTHTVQTQTLFPPLDTSLKGLDLPVFSDEGDVNAERLDQMASKLQGWINSDYAAPIRKNCVVCPVNNALVLDCADGCYSFTVRAADVSDINSISVNCETFEVNFDVPDGTTTEICGWPENAGFTGDECFQAPINGPVAPFPILIQNPTPCQVIRIRYPAHPCAGEYTKDCYDLGSLSWSGSKFNFSMIACVGGVTGCCSGNENHTYSGTNIRATVYSGISTRLSAYETIATGGFSILFGRAGDTPGLPWETEMYLGVGGRIRGNPRYGICINVPTTATDEDFSGIVLMLDYTQNLYIVGSYSHANLRAGDAPTVLNSAAITSVPENLFIANYPSIATGRFRAYNTAGGGTPIFDYSDTGHVAASTNLIGAGFFWIGNVNTGIHAGSVILDSTSYISIVPS